MRFRPIILSLHTVHTAFAPGSCRGQPIVDANDVAKLLLALVFVLDGLGYAERERFNARQARLRDRVQDPFRPIIRAIQGYLRAYHVYRAEALTVREIKQLDTMSRDALEGLQRVFPYTVTYTIKAFCSRTLLLLLKEAVLDVESEL